MKRFTDEQISIFVKNGTLLCLNDKGGYYLGDSLILAEDELNFVIQLTEEFKDLFRFSKDSTKYLVPDVMYLFSHSEIMSNKALFIAWHKAANSFNLDTSNYKNKQDMFRYGRYILALKFKNNSETQLLKPYFWNNLCFGHLDNISKYSTQFSGYFESFDDIIEYQKLLPSEYKSLSKNSRKNIEIHIMYFTYVKCLLRLCTDYSLPIVPTIIISRLEKSKSESCHLETLNVLKKFQFNLIKHIVKRLFETSHRVKVVEKAKEILIENNALEDQTKYILSEDFKTIYNLTIEVNFLSIKQKTNDNLFAAKTLIQLIYDNLKDNFTVFKKDGTWSVLFDIKTLDIKDIDLFRISLEQHINYSCNFFLNPDIIEQISKTNKKGKINFELFKKIQEKFKVGYEKFNLSERLSNKLAIKEKKEKVQKI